MQCTTDISNRITMKTTSLTLTNVGNLAIRLIGKPKIHHRVFIPKYFWLCFIVRGYFSANILGDHLIPQINLCQGWLDKLLVRFTSSAFFIGLAPGKVDFKELEKEFFFFLAKSLKCDDAILKQLGRNRFE